MNARKLMIVEDEMLVQLHLEQIVKDMGHEVTATATSAEHAIEEASRVAPDLVLMDISLPGARDGISAAKELRERFGCAVVFATAHADEDTLKRTESVAASGYLVKPFTSAEVRAVVGTALAHPRVEARPGTAVGVTPANVDPGRTIRHPFGPGTRMLVYSHDTFGMGHLQRSLKLIRSVMEHHPETSVLLVTGSPVAHRYELPDGADYVKLPAVQKVGSDAYASRTLAMSGPGVRNLRSNLLLRIVRDYDPNVLLVDHSPAGMQGELVPALEWLTERTRCRRILGLRDVTDDAANVRDSWRKQGIYELLHRCYDDIVIYGDRQFYDPVVEYQLPAALSENVHFLGFVCDRTPPESQQARGNVGKSRVAVSIGGGDGAVSMILDYLAMIRRFGSELDVHTEILTGPLAGAEDKRRIHEQADGLPVVIHEFMHSTTRFFAEADLVVATAGYNTVTQLLCHGRRALLIPRVLHRREQLVRARRLEALGLVSCLNPMDCSPERLFAAVRDALAGPEDALVEARRQGMLPLDGAERFAEFCGQLMVESVAEPASRGGQ
ncbi:MAG: response regulator [Deltaproteobacteria bacterium]|nr:response regulator [Deltaproteobacteria bacterium]